MLDELESISKNYEFNWRLRNCYTLHCLIRSTITPNRPELPDYGWVFAKFSRNNCPPNIISRLLIKSGRAKIIDRPEIGDIVLLAGEKGEAIGTYLGDIHPKCQDGVIMFGVEEKPVMVPDWLLPNVISYWDIA